MKGIASVSQGAMADGQPQCDWVCCSPASDIVGLPLPGYASGLDGKDLEWGEEEGDSRRRPEHRDRRCSCSFSGRRSPDVEVGHVHKSLTDNNALRLRSAPSRFPRGGWDEHPGRTSSGIPKKPTSSALALLPSLLDPKAAVFLRLDSPCGSLRAHCSTSSCPSRGESSPNPLRLARPHSAVD